MSVMSLTKEQQNYRMALSLIFEANEFMESASQVLESRPSSLSHEGLRIEMKKTITVYNLLKKFWDEGDEESLRKFLKLFLLTNRKQLSSIIVIGSSGFDLTDTMANLEDKGYSDGEYLAYCNQLKFLYDLRTQYGIKGEY
jgi:hypothetical protein